jgi:hypothetical protein
MARRIVSQVMQLFGSIDPMTRWMAVVMRVIGQIFLLTVSAKSQANQSAESLQNDAQAPAY